MARIGYTDTQTVTDAGIVTTLRTFFGNLTTWTVGSLEVFQAATTSERNYYVLSHNVSTAEILIIHCPPGGTLTTLDTSTLAAYQSPDSLVETDGGFQNAVGYAYSPGGGYLAGFTGGFDPASDASFWPADSTIVYPWLFYQEFTSQARIYMFEDDAHAELIIYEGQEAQSNRGYGMHFISDQLITADYPGATYQNYGVFYRSRFNEVGPQTINNPAWSLYDGAGNPVPAFNYNPILGGLTGLTDSNQPGPDGQFLTRELAVVSADGVFQGTLNTSREVGRMTSTYGTLRGGGQFVHIYEDIFDPWATNLLTPPVT